MVKERIANLFSTPIKTITTLGSVVAAIGAIIGGILTVDSRYVHAEDFKQQIEAMQWSQQSGLDELRKKTIEDELFKLRLAPPSRTNDALIKRYEEQLREVTNRLNRNPNRIN